MISSSCSLVNGFCWAKFKCAVKIIDVNIRTYFLIFKLEL
jgi:hypothetical protein